MGKSRIVVVMAGCLFLSSFSFGMYNPEVGRFMQHDPHGINPAGGKINPYDVRKLYTDGTNIYMYVRNNPCIHTDTFGLFQGALTAASCLCNAQANFAAKQSMYGMLLLDRLKSRGCTTTIQCGFCTKGRAGQYSPGKPGTVTLCYGRNSTQGDMKRMSEVIVHELVHAWDACTGGDLDYNDCADAACREIRAYKYDGACGGDKDCIKMYALSSLRMHPNEECSSNASQYVEDNFSKCESMDIY